MSRRYITVAEQQQVIDRARRRCEYCQCHMDYTSQSFVLEHILAIANGGVTSLDNLALACGGCNGHKAIKQEALDPADRIRVVLYHPRLDVWGEHFCWSENTLQMIGLTSTGRATIASLQLNRSGVINVRRLLILADLHPPDLG
jgi:HNH endonuclease